MLFTDLVGSTELMARLGDVAYDALRREHFSRLREALAAHDGVEVKNTGDGILATFSSVVEALAAAVAMQQAAERQARSAGAPLAIRVGLSLGEVTLESGDVFGTPVVEAARLVAAARPGQILATAIVRVVAGSRGPTAMTDVGPMELKGLPDPVAACEVSWAPAAAALPLPPVVTGTGRVFVGRDEQLERLGQLWKESAAGERRLVLLGGEPGIGKTRLAGELAGSLHADGTTVLGGRCDEDLGVPYQPFVEALRHYVAHSSDPRLGRHPEELVRIVPEVAERVADLPQPLRSDPETERYRLFDAVAAWLSDVSGETPVLLVLDDLQWAAKPTLLLLRHVLRSSDPLRLLVAATYRDTDIGRGDPLTEFLADVRRIEGVERLALSGLDAGGVAALLERIGGRALGSDGELFAQALWRETEGNPFFVVEVLRHLSESGTIHERDGHWVATGPVQEIGIPEGVRDVVGRRLSRLTKDANRVLACASVVGLEFDPVLVQTAGGFSEDSVLSALEEAIATRLVVEVPGTAPRNRFAHSLVRATLYDELTAARRVALHRRVAEAIETLFATDLDDHLPALAHHWARASAPAAETSRAVDYATRAGDWALAQLAHDEAVAYYRQALDLLDAGGPPSSETTRLELLIAMGEAQRRSGDPDHRQTLLDAARLAKERGDAGAMARAALANGRGLAYSSAGRVDMDRVTALEDALAARSEQDDPIRARLLARLALELYYGTDRERLVRLSDQALAMARRLDDPATLSQVLLARYYAILTPDTRAERWQNTSELLTLTEHLGDQAQRSRALLLRFRVAMESGDVAEAARCLAANECLTAELRQPELGWFAALNRVALALLAGRLDEAERLVHDAREIGTATGQPDSALLTFWQLALVRFEQGRLDEIIDEIVRQVRDTPGIPAAEAFLAMTYAELDHREGAREAFEGLADSGFARLPYDGVWAWAVTTCAGVCAYLGDVPRAALLHDLLAAHDDQLGVLVLGTPTGSVSHFLGILATTQGRFDEAEGRFAAAEATHDRIGAPTWLARTRLEWARMLLTRRQPGDAERARELVGRGLATARELGLGNVERQAVELLEAT